MDKRLALTSRFQLSQTVTPALMPFVAVLVGYGFAQLVQKLQERFSG